MCLSRASHHCVLDNDTASIPLHRAPCTYASSGIDACMGGISAASSKSRDTGATSDTSNIMPAPSEPAGADEAPMSDRARDVWVEHLVTTYMDMSQPDWSHLCATHTDEPAWQSAIRQHHAQGACAMVVGSWPDRMRMLRWPRALGVVLHRQTLINASPCTRRAGWRPRRTRPST